MENKKLKFEYYFIGFIALILCLISEHFIPIRILLLLCFAILLITEIYKSFGKSIKEKIEQFRWLKILLTALWVVAFLCFVNSIRYYYFPSGAFLHFAAFSVAVGAVIGVAVGLKRTNKYDLRNLKIRTVILSCIMVTVLTLTTVYHLNYLLDFSEPEVYTSVIEDKDSHQGGYRRRSRYEFEVAADGKIFDLYIPVSLYHSYDEGDQFAFKKYNGAFGKAFFIAEP